MTDTIFITGLVIHARHGVMEHETEVGQRFVIDLELYTDLSESSHTDRLVDTVSYANVVTSVRRVTQINAGKNTPGVDKVVVKTPTSRGSPQRFGSRQSSARGAGLSSNSSTPRRCC